MGVHVLKKLELHVTTLGGAGYSVTTIRSYMSTRGVKIIPNPKVEVLHEEVLLHILHPVEGCVIAGSGIVHGIPRSWIRDGTPESTTPFVCSLRDAITVEVEKL